MANMIQTPAASEVTMDWGEDFISDLVFQMDALGNIRAIGIVATSRSRDNK